MTLETQTFTDTLVVETCGECHITFGMTVAFRAARRAAERREDFERDVARVAHEQNITEREARPVAAASRRVRREVERRRSS